MKQTLPIIELKEDVNGNLKGIKTVDQMIEKILDKGDTELYRNCIDKFLGNNISAEIWRQNSPKKLSKDMAKYQEYNVDYDKDRLDDQINENGLIVPSGQYLFHGGFFGLAQGKTISLDRLFSTSLYPGEALFHSQIAGRAYDNDEMVLLSLQVDNSNTKAMILFQKKTLLSHEQEVLFASGLNLTVESKTIIRENFKVKNDDGTEEKEVPVCLLRCRIS